VTGHTSWNELRGRAYAERPGMAERVAALRTQDRAGMADSEPWEIELEAEAVGDPPSEEALREQLMEAVGKKVRVLDSDVEVRTESGRVLLLVVLVIAVGVGAAAAAKRFSQADRPLMCCGSDCRITDRSWRSRSGALPSCGAS
jgi:hypothetical protein